MLYNMLNQTGSPAWSIQVLSRYNPQHHHNNNPPPPTPIMMLRLLSLRLTVLSTAPSLDLDRAGNSQAYSRTTRTTSCRVLGRDAGGLKIKARVQESIKTDLKYLRPQISNLRRAAKPVDAQR